MPHKRNPVASARALAAAVRAPGLVATMLAAMPQEHERALGGWQAEWETLPALAAITAEASTAIAWTLADLEVNWSACARISMRLVAWPGPRGWWPRSRPFVGRVEAARLVEEACRHAATRGRPLADVAAEAPPSVRTSRGGHSLPWTRLLKR